MEIFVNLVLPQNNFVSVYELPIQSAQGRTSVERQYDPSISVWSVRKTPST